MQNFFLESGQFVNNTFDDDFYKFTMQNAVRQKYPDAYVKIRYTLRNKDKIKFPDNFAKQLQNVLKDFDQLKPPKDGGEFLFQKAPYLSYGYIDFVTSFRFNPTEVQVFQQNDELFINIEGFYFRTIRWEVVLMSTISELFFKMTGVQANLEIVENRTSSKASALNLMGTNYADYGTRRRFSFEVHDKVVETLKRYGSSNFVGTSNLYLAQKHN